MMIKVAPRVCCIVSVRGRRGERYTINVFQKILSELTAESRITCTKQKITSYSINTEKHINIIAFIIIIIIWIFFPLKYVVQAAALSVAADLNIYWPCAQRWNFRFVTIMCKNWERNKNNSKQVEVRISYTFCKLLINLDLHAAVMSYLFVVYFQVYLYKAYDMMSVRIHKAHRSAMLYIFCVPAALDEFFSL